MNRIWFESTGYARGCCYTCRLESRRSRHLDKPFRARYIGEPMAREHFMSMMPTGVVELCRYWCDEDCPADAAIDVAEQASGYKYGTGAICCMDIDCPTIGGALVWLKSRLIERGVLRALAVELQRGDGTGGPFVPERPEPHEWNKASPAELRAWREKWGWKADDRKLGYQRSGLHRSPLHIQPVNSVADRVVHFEGREHCPYCRKWFRNGAALRLHVIDNHLEEYQKE